MKETSFDDDDGDDDDDMDDNISDSGYGEESQLRHALRVEESTF